MKNHHIHPLSATYNRHHFIAAVARRSAIAEPGYKRTRINFSSTVTLMALRYSKRLLPAVVSSYKLHCNNNLDGVCRSFHILSNALHDHDIGETPSSMEYSILRKAGFSLMGTRGLCTSMLSSESTEGSFPSDLLSRKQIITPERAIGQLQDLVIPVTNFQNDDKGMMVLAGDVFDVPIRKDIIHRVVRWQLAKRQQGTHSTKTISEVSGTGRKPWRQKGTGRARHGTMRGPQFRHGAVMHGPKPRSHAFKLNKKVRRLGLKIALSARAAEGKLLVFDDLTLPTHKTKNIVSYVKQMEETKKLLLVDGGSIDEKLKLATQNLHYVNVLPSIGLNVYDILLHDTLVMSRDAVNKIVDRMHTPINR